MGSPGIEWIELKIVKGKLSMNKRNGVHATTEPRGTPLFTDNGWNRSSLTRLEMVSLLEKFDVHGKRDRGNSNVGSFIGRPSCQTQSKAIEISTQTRYVSLQMPSRPTRSVRRGPVDRLLNGGIGNNIGGPSAANPARETNSRPEATA